MTLVYEEPSMGPIPEPGRHRLVHLVCCNPRRGLCSANTAALTHVPDTTAVSCTLCDAVDEAGITCGAFLCRFRQWLRGTFGSAQ
jgi:hypothetical protein